MLELAPLKMRIIADNSKALDDIKKTGKEMIDTADKVKVQWDKAGSTLTNIGGKMSTYFTMPILAATGAAVKLSSDMSESVNKIESVFAGGAESMKQWASTSIETMGLSRQSALDMAAGFGDMGNSMGIANATNREMSTTITQLAADMASFKNVSVERAATALNGIYTGEGEALKSLGIVMTEATLQQFAINEGIKTQYSNMTQAEKVMLRYRYVLKNTTTAQGDFVRTGGGLANQSRMITENLKDLGEELGSFVAPAINNIMVKINEWITGLRNMDPEQQKLLVGLGLTVAAVGPVMSAIGGLITMVQTATAAMAAFNLSTGGIVAIVATAAVAIGSLGASFLLGGNAADETAIKIDDLGTILNDTAEDADALGDSVNALPDGKNIDINADTERAQTNVSNLLEKSKQVVSKDVIFNVDTTNANTNVQTLAQSLADLLDGSGKFKTEAKDLKSILEEQTTALTNYYNSLTASQILFLTGLRQQGNISAEEYNKMVGEVISVQQNQTATTEAQKKANEALIKTINGDGEITMKESESIYQMLTEGYDLTAVASLTASEAYTKFAEAVKNGYGDTELAAEYASQFATALNSELKTAAEAAAAAEDKYTTAIDNANTKAAAQKAAVEELITARTNEKYAIDFMISAYNSGYTAVEALEQAEKYYGHETIANLNTIFAEKGGIAEASYLDLYNASMEYEDDILSLQKEKNGGYKKIEEQHQSDLLAAEQAYVADLAAINTTFTVEDLARWKALYESQGYVIDEETSKSLDTMMKFLKDIEDGVITDGDTIQSQWDTIWNSLPQYIKDSMTNSKDAASSGGNDVGIKLGGGIEAGIETAKAGIIRRAKNAVAAAIAAMKQEAQTASPSKKVKKEVGLQMGAAVGIGFEESVQDNIKKVKSGISDIIKGGKETVNDSIRSRQAISYNTNNANTQNNTFNFQTKPLTMFQIENEAKRIGKALMGGVI